MADLKVFRRAHHMTQNDLAEILGISQAQVALLESGARVPSNKILKQFDVLVGDSKKAQIIPDIPIREMMRQINEDHLNSSIEYLDMQLKDLIDILHKAEKKLQRCKDRYSAAVVELLVTSYYTEAVKKSNDKKLVEDEVEERKFKLAVAHDNINLALKDQPEIILVKIQGLKEEIRKLKPILARKKKHLKNRNFDSLQIPGMEPEAPKAIEDEESNTPDLGKSTPDTPPPAAEEN